jgi:hypothetical protein
MGKSKIIGTKICPVCKIEFTLTHLSPGRKEKTTCSAGCANTYFRSGENNPNWKASYYRTTCFLYHEKKCIICGEINIVHAHHFDGDKTNNSPETNKRRKCGMGQRTIRRLWFSYFTVWYVMGTLNKEANMRFY